uniref:Exocyst subunit Exo70 family protein n=1 Tax=Leersia perrieri TaxID=77586 RepID=A0A0D9VH04_9ORYZ
MARVLELDSSSRTAGFSSLLAPSRGYDYKYLEKIQSLSLVSSGGSSSSSSGTARSNEYGGSMSGSESSGSHHRYYVPSSFLRAGFEVLCVRDITKQMVRDGFVLNLMGEYSRTPGGCPPVLERWFSELDVGWVLLRSSAAREKELDDEGGGGLGDLARRWMRGYAVMVHALAATSTTRVRPLKLQTVAVELASDQLQDDDLRFARFAEASVSRMLAFAAALAACNTWRCPMDKLLHLMQLHSCIPDQSGILMTSLEQEAGRLVDSEEMQSLFNKMDHVVSSTGGNLATAIWRMAKKAEAVTPVLSGYTDSWETFPRNAEIHEVTRLIVKYARLFWENQSVLENILCSYYSNDEPEDHQTQYLTTLIVQMITNLERHLEKKSESFSDSSLRYMFLLNNSYFIHDQFLATTYSLAWKAIIKNYEQYQESYMLLSWEHVLYCLHDKMPLWFPKYSSPLARFDSEFQKTCRHQKMWKVPCPKLRKTLREDIIGKVIAGLKKYLQDHPEQEKCCSDHQDIKDMVNELFEG